MKIKGDSLISLAIVVFFVVFIVLSLGYNSTARLVPLLIGVPLLILAVFQFLLDSVPAFKERFGHLGQGDLLGVKKIKKGRKSQKKSEGEVVNEERKDLGVDSKERMRDEGKVFTIFSWVGGLLAGLLLIGYIITIPVFIFAFLKIAGKRSWKLSVISGLISGFVTYYVFDSVLQLHLYEGILTSLF